MLSRFEAVLAVPIYQVCLTLMLITYGNFYFGEMENLDDTRIAVFAAAVFVIFIGVYLLSQRLPQVTEYPDWLKESGSYAGQTEAYEEVYNGSDDDYDDETRDSGARERTVAH